jgi:hypothetical protein
MPGVSDCEIVIADMVLAAVTATVPASSNTVPGAPLRLLYIPSLIDAVPENDVNDMHAIRSKVVVTGTNMGK